jgi:ABC-type nitrate/sulfonate/bicarbonate transport system permease component
MLKLGRVRLDPLGLLGVAILIGLWLALLPFTPRAMLPSPLQVVRYLAESFFYAPNFRYFGLADHSFLSALTYSVSNVLLAVGFGSVVGILLGLFSARVSALRAGTDPIALTVGNVPILIASPFLLMWFGSGRLSTVLVVAFYVSVTLYVYSQRAAVNLSPVYEASARTFGASTPAVVRDVLLPGTLPEILGGIRIALAGSWGLEAVAELLGDQRGIGKAIRSLATAMDVEGLFAALLLLGLTAMIVDLAAARLVSGLSSWRTRDETENA